MTTARINELRKELEAERISYGELAEIEAAFAEIPDGRTAIRVPHAAQLTAAAR